VTPGHFDMIAASALISLAEKVGTIAVTAKATM
jgi:hypothetical protein